MPCLPTFLFYHPQGKKEEREAVCSSGCCSTSSKPSWNDFFFSAIRKQEVLKLFLIFHTNCLLFCLVSMMWHSEVLISRTESNLKDFPVWPPYSQERNQGLGRYLICLLLKKATSKVHNLWCPCHWPASGAPFSISSRSFRCIQISS